MTGLEQALARYMEALAVRGQRPQTVTTRASALRLFLTWCGERGLTAPSEITAATLARYQRHLYHYREPGGPGVGRGRGRGAGQPLSVRTQHGRLTAVRLFFRWLARERWIGFNPASELELPRLPMRLPRAILSAAEVAALLSAPDVTTAAGLRDRAMLETLYATGLRRGELAGLAVYDVDRSAGTVMVRDGKGGRDRLVPISAGACAWIERYQVEVRPDLLADPDATVLFVNEAGQPWSGERLTALVKRYLHRAGIDKPGACHLFRHTMATQMLDNGAELRFIQALLGHVNIETTTLYTHVSLAKLKAVYAGTHPGARAAPSAPGSETGDGGSEAGTAGQMSDASSAGEVALSAALNAEVVEEEATGSDGVE